MELKTYIRALQADQRESFALRCETSIGHLRNVMYGYKACATDLAVRIEHESAMQVRRWDLRQDWANHWPELIGLPDAPAIAAPDPAPQED